MSIRNKLAIALVAFLAPFVFASTATAQAGLACSGTTCGLGGQIRGQIGDGLPLPISIAPAQGGSGPAATEGPFTAITIQTAPATPSGLPLVGNGLGQPGQIKPTTMATIQQGAGPGPRNLTLAPGVFHYGGQPQGSIGVVNFNAAVFAVQTNLTYDSPHPGTTPMGAAAVTQESLGAIPIAGQGQMAVGGRTGAAIVSYYQGATTNGPGTPGNNWGNGVPPSGVITPMAGDAGTPPVNGLARFTATGNQFGGVSIGRANGTAKVYFNGVPLVPALDLPCKVTATPLQGTNAQGVFVPYQTGTDCQFSLSVVDLELSDATVGVAGGPFENNLAIGTAFTTPSGVHFATIGFNGTIIGDAGVVTLVGAGIPFTGQGNQGVGVPFTTGMLSVTVTDVVGATSEMFIRTGIDARDAGGNGVVSLITGSLTARDISAGNANRTWVTLEIPEPSTIFAASAGLFALFGMHRLARRRS